MIRIVLFPLLLPLSILFAFFSILRGKFYDWKVLSSSSVSCKVICVGNITSGGTGKTPIIRWMAQEISKRGKKVSVLSRGYKRKSLEILKVDSTSSDVSKYGDEALQLARQLKPLPIYVGADRLSAAQKIVSIEHADVILMDDGFQHRRLKRDLDFLVIDATQPGWNYWPLPLGYGRESFSAVKRASAILLSKSNLVTDAEVINFKCENKRVLEFTSHITRLRSFEGEAWDFEKIKNEKIALLSAIGRPQNFEQQLRDLGLNVVFHKIFRDHHDFQSDEIGSFLSEIEKYEVQRVLITEKDAVKLTSLNFPKQKFLIVEHEVQLKKGREDFDRLIAGLFS